MWLPWKSKPPLLGVDLNPYQIRLMQLSEYRRRCYRVECYATQPVKAASTPLSMPAAMSRALQHALHKLGTYSAQVAIAVPSSAIMSKTVTLPAVSSAIEMESQVLLEAEQHISFPLSEVMLDFAVLGPSPAVIHHVEVLLVVARRTIVEQRLAIIQSAGLQCKIIDVAPQVLQRAYCLLLNPMANQQGAEALLVFEQDSFSLDIFIGHSAVQNLVQAALSNQQHMLDMACQAIQSYMLEYGALTQLWLAGLCEPGMMNVLSNQLGIPVTFANPFIDMVLRSEFSSLSQDINAANMLMACSLALRRFD